MNKRELEISTMDIIPLPYIGPGYELTFPVTLKVSNKVKNTSDVRTRIIKALMSWAEDGPGLVPHNEKTQLMGITVDEMASEKKIEGKPGEEGKAEWNSSLSRD